MERISIYIPAYNAAEHIERCVEGVRSQTYPVDEILVIDDGSRDETATIAEKLAGVRVIRQDTNCGVAEARNTAIREARNEFVGSLDADTSPDPSWLAELKKQFDNKRVAAAGGPLVESAIHGVADRFRREYMTQSWGKRLRRNPPWIYGSNVLARKSVVQEVGGYDPSKRTNGEDVDMSSKLKKAGYDTLFVPTAVVFHYRTDSVRSIFDTYWRWHLFGLGIHLQPPSLLRTAFWGIFFFIYAAAIGVIHIRACLDLPVLLMFAYVPFYMNYRLIRFYLERARQSRGSDVP